MAFTKTFAEFAAIMRAHKTSSTLLITDKRWTLSTATHWASHTVLHPAEQAVTCDVTMRKTGTRACARRACANLRSIFRYEVTMGTFEIANRNH